MKRILILTFVFVFAVAGAFAGEKSKKITDGSFVIKGASGDTENASMISEAFSVMSYLGGASSNWSEVCKPCGFGQTITVPTGPYVDLGAMGSQFRTGRLTIDGTTHENVFFSGVLLFDQQQIFIPRTVRRRGNLYFTREFEIEGRLRACEVSESVVPCPANKLLMDTPIHGSGTLTVTLEIKDRIGPRPLLQQKSFEYRFHQ